MRRFAVTFISFLLLFGVAADEWTSSDIPTVQHPQRRDIPAAEYSVPIADTVPRSRKTLQYLRETGGFTSSLAGSSFDQAYLVNVTIGGKLFRLIVDTGSSDTWVPQIGFSCLTMKGAPTTQDACAFGTSGFDPSKSSTFKLYPNTNFNISYGGGEYLTGNVGFDTVQVGGLSVKGQEIGLVTKAAWDGDGVSSGILGLASPNLTSVFAGTDPLKDSRGANNHLPYNPFFFTAVQEKLVSNPYFSIALNRGSFEAKYYSTYDPNLGYISFGGIAPVPITNNAVTVPIKGYRTYSDNRRRDVTYYYYTVDAEFSFMGSKIFIPSNNTILDSGTTLNYLPTTIANAFNAAFVPPAVFSKSYGAYVTLCSAKAPGEFTVKIGGRTFIIEPADQLLPIHRKDDKGRDLCISGTTDGGPVSDKNIFILGDTFLHNVVTTFNIATDEVTITQRQTYGSRGGFRRAVRPSVE